MAMTVCGGTPILHDDTQNLKGVLVIADQFFPLQSSRYKAEMGVSFLDMSNLITGTVIYIIESK